MGYSSIIKATFPQLQRGNIVSNGLVGAWPFYEMSGGKIYDVSGQGNHATISGSSVSRAAGGNGAAVSFPGTGSNNAACVSDAIAASHDFSVVIYTAPAVVNADNVWIVSQGASTGTDRVIQCGLHNANPQFNFWSDDWQPSGSNLSANQWYWLIFTFVTATKARRIYYNGNLIGPNTATGNPVGGGVLKFGGDSSLFANSPYNGKVGEVRVYNRTLSVQEVTRISMGQG